MEPVLLLLVALPALAQVQNVQRALTRSDQQSVEFAPRQKDPTSPGG